MKYIKSNTNDPYFNLAMEEYLTKNINESILYLYQNSPSVIIGKNQNPHSEVGIDFIKKQNIKLVRRLSGGGSVYHDLGNLNYAFILKDKKDEIYNFKKFSQPIVDVLNKLNLDVNFTGRNDLVINELKISGSAQYVSGNNLLHHGTLLYDVDFSNVSHILKPNSNKLKSKGVKSVSSRVTNIKDLLPKEVTFDVLTETIIKEISNGVEFKLEDSELLEIKKIANEKLNSIKFILSDNKNYDNQNVEYIPGFGTIEIYSNVVDNKIDQIEIFGEYFFKEDINFVKDKLIGVSFDLESIKEAIDSIGNFEKYFHRLEKDKLSQLIWGRDEK